MNTKLTWSWILFAAGLVLLSTACSPTNPSKSPTAESTAETATSQIMSATLPPDALLRFQNALFSTSGNCAYCHTAMKDAAGNDVSIDSDWRSSIMANSTLDPYYRASVRSEVLANPEHQDVIENKCTVCHAGMAYHTAEIEGSAVRLLPDEGFFDQSHASFPIAADGVSCTLCHQITPDNLGQLTSFSGGYSIDLETPQGERIVYGNFAVDDAMAAIMSSASGYIPQQSDHVKKSETCAVCHTLFTPTILDDGTISEELFPEQTASLEWQFSAYQAGASCQGCHLPQAEGDVPIANTGSPARRPFMQHTFSGGNAYMIGLLSNNREALGVTASAQQLENSQIDILTMLKEKTAGLSVNAVQEESNLVVKVTVSVKTGHKFPTSFPSRRAWLHMLVKDETGKIVFESGQWEADGKIIGNDNDSDGSLYEPHYAVITAPDEVQIYEAIIGDPNGEVTTTLLRAKNYLKDNRLLPIGFDKATADNVVAVYGQAAEDEDFRDGGDQVIYQIPAVPGVYTVEVELLYQSIGYRWSERFRGEDNPEGAEFYGYADAMDNAPVIVTRQVVQVK